MQLDPARHTLGLLAGSGEYPRLVAEGAQRAGVRVVCAGFRGAAKAAELRPLCAAYRTFRIGSVEKPTAFFRQEGVTHVLMAGQIKPASIYTMWPDATARRLLGQMDRRNAHTIFGTVCRYAHEYGWEVLPSTTFMEAHMPQAGHIAGPPPTDAQLREACHGMQTAREIARLDIGQSIVVQGEKVLCIEAFKGTNECLKTGGNREQPVTLCKVTKPGHDMRFDVPCIGLGTIAKCRKYHVNHIVIEAGHTIILQHADVLRLCDQWGITLHAMDIPTGGITVPELPDMESDAEHARRLASSIETLGLGHSAVVCDGVAIAVEDPEGALKCLRRAGAYMRRLWLMRLLNWLLRLLLGISSAPPAPMVMAGTPQLQVDAELRRAARKAGVRLVE